MKAKIIFALFTLSSILCFGRGNLSALPDFFSSLEAETYVKPSSPDSVPAGEKSSTKNDYYTLGRKYYYDAKNDSALLFINRGLENIDTTDYENIAQLYILRSTIFGNLSLFERSMADAFQALNISEQHNIINTKGAAQLCIGKIHYMMYDDNKAEEFMLKADNTLKGTGFEKEITEVTYTLGEFYNVLEQPTKSFFLLTEALNRARQQADTLHIIKCLMGFGDYYTNLNRWTNPVVGEYQQAARKYLNEAMKLAEQKNIPIYINNINFCLVRWYRVDKNYNKALEYALKILESADENNYTLLSQVYHQLVSIYAYLGNTEMIIKSQAQCYSIMIKQSNFNLHQALQEMETKYETTAKQLEIEQQKAKINRQKNIQILYMVGLAITVLMLFLLINTIRLSRKRNRELREMNATKDKFFSIISHDLKNPAIAQRNALQILVENFSEWDWDLIKEFSSELLKSATEQVELIYNLLTWAQTQTQRMSYNPAAFDLMEALYTDISLIKSTAENKRIDLVVDCPTEVIVFGDRNMLVTVVRNMLNNAIKYTQETNKVGLIVKPAGEYYEITIVDTGIGMSKEQMENLFKLDKQHIYAGTAGERGNGIGLIVCMEMIEKHGSTITVESTVGVGSSFMFRLKKA